MARDHGGNLEAARARWGDGDWIDLSTGINRAPYPVPTLPPEVWAALPTAPAHAKLIDAASAAYGADPARILPLAGAQAAIQLYPRLGRGVARVLTPTYNEHAGSLAAQGWTVQPVSTLDALSGADLAVVVNPNNPDGHTYAPDDLRALAGKVGLLIVDESFADPEPSLSVAAANISNVIVLRSFGKFFGLAGVRLGFAIAAPQIIDQMQALSGPWSVAGPALHIGALALRDTAWAEDTRQRLAEDAARLDAIAPWPLVGGCALFRTYETANALEAQAKLAKAKIWARAFPYSGTWLRLGLPHGTEWDRVKDALT